MFSSTTYTIMLYDLLTSVNRSFVTKIIHCYYCSYCRRVRIVDFQDPYIQITFLNPTLIKFKKLYLVHYPNHTSQCCIPWNNSGCNEFRTNLATEKCEKCHMDWL